MATRSDATTTEQPPIVLECDLHGDQAIVTAERGDVSVIVAAPAGISAAEIEPLLEGVPESIENVAELFDRGEC